MVKELTDRGWDVRGIDISSLPFQPNVNRYFEVGVEVFDLVVHAAYHVGGRAGIDGRNTNFIKNVQLDSNMFDWALRSGQKAVLYFSSCAAYPAEIQNFTDDRKPFTEDRIDLDRLRPPFDNYGWGKINGERLAATAGDNGLRVHVVRPFSGYAEDQDLVYPFPSIIQRAKDGDLAVFGPPNQTRDWVHVIDCVKGSLSIYEDDERRPTNLCTGVATEFGDLMRMAAYQSWSGRGQLLPLDAKVTYLTDKPFGTYYRVGDPTRMNEHYAAKISIEEGVQIALQRTRA